MMTSTPAPQEDEEEVVVGDTDRGGGRGGGGGDSNYLINFFQSYDILEREAATLASDHGALQEAQRQHKFVTEELKWVTSSIDFNKDSIKEQMDRIELVSNHWFYGKTLFQPQLWLRGGCEGKIDRARVKLLKAVQDHPKLEQSHVDLTRRIGPARDLVTKWEVAYGRSYQAHQQVQQMREALVQRYPTNQLYQLLHQEANIQGQIREQGQEQKEQLDKVEFTLIAAKRCASNVETKVQSATKKIARLQQLLLVSSKKDETSSSLVEDGATGSVATRQSAASAPSATSTTPTAYLAKDILEEEQEDILEEEDQDHVEHMKEDAAEDFECATQELKSGFEFLRNAMSALTMTTDTSTSNPSAAASPMFVLPPPSQSSIDSSSSTADNNNDNDTKNKGSMLRVQAHQLESAIKEQEMVLVQRRQAMEMECTRLDQQLSNVRFQIVTEKNGIFDSVRARSRPASSATSLPSSHHQQHHQHATTGAPPPPPPPPPPSTVVVPNTATTSDAVSTISSFSGSTSSSFQGTTTSFSAGAGAASRENNLPPHHATTTSTASPLELA